jgi:hypothetical protein
MFSAHQLGREVRQPGYNASSASGSEAPPPFMTVPTTCARAAVRMLHNAGAEAAKTYLANSKVGEWTGHSHRSLASSASAVVDGFDWYAGRNAADGRAMRALDNEALITLPAGQVSVRLDVVLNDGSDVAGRVVLWDAPDFTEGEAPVIACAFAHALQVLYPGRSFTTVGVWQARRQRLVEVLHATALAATAAASTILASM